MSVFDIMITVVLLGFSMKGVGKGAIREIIGLFFIFVALIIAPIFAEGVGSFMVVQFKINASKDIFYFIGLFSIVIGTLMFNTILSLILSFIVKFSGLSIFNRILGFFVGGIKSILVISLLIGMGMKIDLVKNYIDKHVDKSIYYPTIVKISNLVTTKMEIIKGNTINNKRKIEVSSKKMALEILNNKNIKSIKNSISNTKNQETFIHKINDSLNQGIKEIER